MIKKSGVIGHPICHTLSPVLHGHWIEQNNVSGQYDAYDVSPDALGDFVANAKKDMVGFNVTVPHKNAIVAYCDTVSELAKLVGAVNTIVIKDGMVYGDNTDVFGFVTALLENVKNKNKTLLKNKAVIFGAGGACRAGIIALKKLGFENIIIVNRTYEKAVKLAKEFGVDAVDMQDVGLALENATLLANTSIAGMNGDNIIDIDMSSMHSDAVVYDIVYKPLYTDMLGRAVAQNLCAVTGIDMLLYQAVSGFEKWFGVAPVVDDCLRNKVLNKG